jgi:signal transduction histidine kinase
VDAFVRSLVARRPGVIAEAPDPARAFTDPRRLERIIDNLLDNCARHGLPPVTVSVRGRTIVVTDSGPGFGAEMLERATHRFATGDTARGHGIGLGLAIAAAQARVLDGSLSVANRPEGGAQVTVELSGRAPTEDPAA